MSRTEIALRFGGKYGTAEYLTLAHTLNYVKDDALTELVEILQRIEEKRKVKCV